MLAHHNRPDIFELCLVLTLVLGQGHQSPLVEVLGDLLGVSEQAKDLASDSLSKAVGWVARLKDGTIEAVWA